MIRSIQLRLALGFELPLEFDEKVQILSARRINNLTVEVLVWEPRETVVAE